MVWVGVGFWFGNSFEVFFVHVNFPDSNGVVGAASCKEFDVWRQEETSEVFLVGFENAAW